MPCELVIPSCLEEPSLAPIYFLNEGHFAFLPPQWLLLFFYFDQFDVDLSLKDLREFWRVLPA